MRDNPGQNNSINSELLKIAIAENKKIDEMVEWLKNELTIHYSTMYKEIPQQIKDIAFEYKSDIETVEDQVTDYIPIWWYRHATMGTNERVIQPVVFYLSQPDQTRTELEIDWDLPADPDITEFEILRWHGTSANPPPINEWQIIATVSGSNVYMDTDPSLVAGIKYWYTMRAKYNEQIGPASYAQNIVIYQEAPGPVEGISAYQLNVGQYDVQVWWSAPTIGGQFDTYRLYCKLPGASNFTLIHETTSLTYIDASNKIFNKEYEYMANAYNSASGQESSGSVTIIVNVLDAVAPTAPEQVTLTQGNTGPINYIPTIKVTWVNPNATNEGITNHRIELYDYANPSSPVLMGSVVTNSASTNYTLIEGIDVNGITLSKTYMARVYAINSSGESLPSQDAVITLYNIPTAPVITSFVPTTNSNGVNIFRVTFTFTANEGVPVVPGGMPGTFMGKYYWKNQTDGNRGESEFFVPSGITGTTATIDIPSDQFGVSGDLIGMNLTVYNPAGESTMSNSDQGDML